MSDWYWKVIALKAAFVLTCIVSSYRAEETVQQLPFCNPHNVNTDTNDLMIVSTLDGKLTAFATENGAKVWEIETQPLLSSNLHHVELTSGGKWVRLVPSLRGTLYSISGDNIEPLPFDADQLLSSSFKYSDDLVIAGAKETLWQGIDTATGAVLYACGSGGCSSEQQAAGAGRHVLVLRRHANTVRALDPRSGHEKWNFSVAEHHLALSASPECLGPAGGGAGAVDVRVAVPEGTLAVTRDSSLWRVQLDAPIAGMWRLEAGALKTIDVLWECTRALTDDSAPPPSLYIGVHRTQLYIQESQLYAQKLETAVSTQPLPWKLVETRPLIDGGETALTVQDSPKNTLSLITLYGANGQTVNHGFFLYLQETCDQSVQVSEDLPDSNPDPDHHHIHVHVYSLWFWWKEVLLIAVSSALLMNLMIWPRFFAPKFRAPTPIPSDHQEIIVVERHYDRPPSNNSQYLGRYESDFTPLRCLGHGGFGVVFEARNNIDHRSYAVKRITLPRRESKRERVLREVRALAKLEHEHIVRYFNSWVEEPPAYWQERRDAVWKRELNVSLDMSEDYTVESPTPIKTPISNSVKLTLDKCVDALDYEKQLGSKRNRSLSCNESFSIVFDDNPKSNDDSFIVFANENSKASQNSKGPSDASKGPSNGSKGPMEGSKGPSEESKGLSEARKDSSLDKRLEKVKECDGYVKNEAISTGKKKKGHTRHWSLDMVVRQEETPLASKMYLYIQMQLCRRDSLHDWLRQNRTMAARGDKVKTLFSQIVSAVEYVHLEGLIHRDLKPSNILFAPDGRVKVGDFGLVTTMADSSPDGVPDMDAHDRHTYKVGTHLYMSPEQLAGRPYSYKVDIYSLGVILFELLQPFGTEAERAASLAALRAARYPPAFQEQCPKETEVLKMMLSEDPARRPTASGVRARAPLYQPTEEKYHFNLPTPVSA